eukprot:4306566-Alexandrium_andersonii.AAC.1
MPDPLPGPAMSPPAWPVASPVRSGSSGSSCGNNLRREASTPPNELGLAASCCAAARHRVRLLEQHQRVLHHANPRAPEPGRQRQLQRPVVAAQPSPPQAQARKLNWLCQATSASARQPFQPQCPRPWGLVLGHRALASTAEHSGAPSHRHKLAPLAGHQHSLGSRNPRCPTAMALQQ